MISLIANITDKAKEFIRRDEVEGVIEIKSRYANLNKTFKDLGLFLGVTGARFNAGDALDLGLADYEIEGTKKGTQNGSLFRGEGGKPRKRLKP